MVTLGNSPFHTVYENTNKYVVSIKLTLPRWKIINPDHPTIHIKTDDHNRSCHSRLVIGQLSDKCPSTTVQYVRAGLRVQDPGINIQRPASTL